MWKKSIEKQLPFKSDGIKKLASLISFSRTSVLILWMWSSKIFLIFLKELGSDIEFISKRGGQG